MEYGFHLFIGAEGLKVQLFQHRHPFFDIGLHMLRIMAVAPQRDDVQFDPLPIRDHDRKDLSEQGLYLFKGIEPLLVSVLPTIVLLAIALPTGAFFPVPFPLPFSAISFKRKRLTFPTDVRGELPGHVDRRDLIDRARPRGPLQDAAYALHLGPAVALDE